MNTVERETFSSRLGFILVSAGCAIGLGNVYKFPYITGQYGGAAFILIYLVFLAILGLPVMACEFAVGRAAQCGMAGAFEKLELSVRAYHRIIKTARTIADLEGEERIREEHLLEANTIFKHKNQKFGIFNLRRNNNG